LNVKRIVVLSILVFVLFSATSFRPGLGNSAYGKVILIRIQSSVDYKTLDLVNSAADDIDNGAATTLLIELDSQGGYLAPAMQIVERLNSLKNVIVYIGPGDAAALGVASFIAMASKLLVMNEGASIGDAGEVAPDPSQVNSLMSLMGRLANSNGRNAEAAGSMVIDDVGYSADEAYSKGVCDLKVNDYDSLLSMLNIDHQAVTEKKLDSQPDVNRDQTYQLLKFFADANTIKYMFLVIAGLVALNFLVVLTRPKKSKMDETYRVLLDFMKMEIQSLQLQEFSRSKPSLNETPLQTIGNIPDQPSFKLNRIPTSNPLRRFEKPLEVSER
jgi:membrane-bound ClpP family serine protease